jgi:thermostable 8-oxoguanine DNA glycosylase
MTSILDNADGWKSLNTGGWATLEEAQAEAKNKAKEQKEAKEKAEKEKIRKHVEFCLLAYNTFVLNESGKKLLDLLKEELFAHSYSGHLPDQSRIYFMAGENHTIKRLIWAINDYKQLKARGEI